MASLVLYAAVFAFLCILTLWRPERRSMVHVAFFVAVGVFAQWVVWRAYHYLVPRVVESGIALLEGDDDRVQLIRWFEFVFDVNRQAGAALVGIAVLESLWGLVTVIDSSFPRNPATFVAVGFAAIFVSQGAYWLIWAPGYLTVLSKLRLTLRTADHAESPQMRKLAELVKWFLLVCGATFGVALGLFFAVWPYTRSLHVLGVAYVLALGLIVYFFLRCNLTLTRMIQREKAALMTPLQERIAETLRAGGSTSTDLGLVQALWTLYSNIKATRESTFSPAMLRYFSASILLEAAIPFALKIAVGIAAGKTLREVVTTLTQ